MSVLNKKTMSVFLAFCLAISMVPTQAFASLESEREKAIANLKTAIAECKTDLKKFSAEKSSRRLFSINIKSVAIKKLTAQKGAFKISWAKPKSSQLKSITGYQILWSTKKNMKNGDMKTIKKSSSQGKSRSVVIKGLLGKKKYYVKIRTYKKYGWGNDYSSWSKSMTVTTKAGSSVASSKISVANAVGYYNASHEYTGDDITPNLTVKLNGKTLKAGSDYTVSYQNNFFPGTARITITGKGSYTGSKIFTFTISSHDAVIGSYLGTALTTSGSNGITAIPSSMQSYSRLSFTAYSDATCRLILNGNSYYGAWAPTSVKDSSRLYAIVLDNGSSYVALLSSDGSFTMMSNIDQDYVIFFKS